MANEADTGAQVAGCPGEFELMSEHERGRMTARAQILKALAHPTRLFIVERLAEQEHCVCHLTEMIGADTSTVSKHLSVLKNAGLLRSRKHGTIVYYSLSDACVLTATACVDRIIEQHIAEQSSYFNAGGAVG